MEEKENNLSVSHAHPISENQLDGPTPKKPKIQHLNLATPETPAASAASASSSSSLPSLFSHSSAPSPASGLANKNPSASTSSSLSTTTTATPLSVLKSLNSLFSSPTAAFRIPKTPSTAAAATIPSVSGTGAREVESQTTPSNKNNNNNTKAAVELPSDVPHRLSFRSPFIVKPTAEQATPLVDKEVKSLERQVAQLRAQLVNALEDSAQYEREYSRIKHEGSLLCTKYDDVCKKLREASTEYNNLCDIYDSQVRLFTEDGSFCFVLLSFFLTNTHFG